MKLKNSFNLFKETIESLYVYLYVKILRKKIYFSSRLNGVFPIDKIYFENFYRVVVKYDTTTYKIGRHRKDRIGLYNLSDFF